MNKIFSKLALSSTTLLLGLGTLSTLSAQAATFNFSYTFDSGETLSGMVDGDLLPDGDTVVNLDNLMATYSGGEEIDFSFLLDESVNLRSLTISGERVLFLGTDFPGSGSGSDFFFLVGTGAPFDDVSVGEITVRDNGFDRSNFLETESFNPQKWVVTQKNLETVPEPSSLLAIFGIAAMGYGVKKKTV